MMMENKQSIWTVTLILTAIAGYCDTLTFVAADSIFSAHVTGNFIVFAYQLIKGTGGDWIKLLTFPIFIISVMTGGWIASKFVNKHFLLLCEGVILLASGIAAYFLGYIEDGIITWPMYTITMLVVFAMGFQNAYGKIFPKDTYGPTTMMTGNVTQLALDLKGVLANGWSDTDHLTGFKHGLVTVFGFLIGCCLGAYVGKLFGLVGIVLPGVGMVFCYFYSKSSDELAATS
jgi:uncharacterized membrane protein YoaK (UPF0700 family)